jgi:rare lipoprotein A
VPPPPARIGATETGIASWYGIPYDGRRAADGEIYDMQQLTAAHRSLPFQTWVHVTNLSNGKQVDVRITDRGPFVDGRIIDLSLAAAREIDMVRSGTARVRLKVIQAPAPTTSPLTTSSPTTSSPTTTTTIPDNPTSTPNAPTGEYAVQAGAFSDRSRAEALLMRLSFPDCRIVQRGNSALWRVLVGQALSKDAADALALEVKKAVGDALVVSDR